MVVIRVSSIITALGVCRDARGIPAGVINLKCALNSIYSSQWYKDKKNPTNSKTNRIHWILFLFWLVEVSLIKKMRNTPVKGVPRLIEYVTASSKTPTWKVHRKTQKTQWMQYIVMQNHLSSYILKKIAIELVYAPKVDVVFANSALGTLGANIA